MPASSSSSSSTRMPLQTWFVLGLTYLTYSFMYCTRKPLSIVKNTMKTDMNLTESSGGGIDYPLVETSFFLAYMAGQFCLGALSARFSTKAYILMCVFGSAAACGLFSLASTNAAMTALWSVNGFSQSATNTLLVAYLSDIVPFALRSSILGVWNSCLQVGGVLANNFAALTVELTGGWRAAFAYPALALAGCGLLLSLVLPGAQRSSSNSDSAVEQKGSPSSSPTSAPASEPTPSFMDAVKAPGVLNVATAYLCIKFVRYSLMFNLADYLQSLGYSQTTAAMMASIFDFAGIFGSVASGFVADKLFGGRIIAAVTPLCAACGACLVAMVFTAELSVVACATTMGLAGFFIAGPDGVIGGPAAKYLCEFAGLKPATGKAACGFVNGIASLGTCFQSYVVTFAVTNFGWNGFFYFIGTLVTLATVVCYPALRMEREGVLRQQKRDS